MPRKQKEYKVTATFTDMRTGIEKNVEDLTPDERRRAVILMDLRAVKSYYGSRAIVRSRDPRAKELCGIDSL